MPEEEAAHAKEAPHAEVPGSGSVTRLLVGWDGTPPSEAAIDWALARSAGAACPIEIVRTVDETYVSADYVVTESTVEWVRQELVDRVRRLFAVHPSLDITARLFQGDPVEELRRESDPATLIVVGTHARKGPAVRLAWSLGARLAAMAPGPVAVIPIPDAAPHPASGSVSAGSVLAGIATGVVVGVDGSPASILAIDFAAVEALRLGTVLTAVHAWLSPPMWLDAQLDEESLTAMERMHDEILTEALVLVAAKYKGLVIERSLIMGDPHWALIEAAKDAALLVMGNHGRRGISRMLLGSVSHSVILNMTVPTVVVREPGR